MTVEQRSVCPHAALVAAAPGHTKKGCTCKTQCGASIEEDNYNCDWCYTEANCGSSGFKGTWDFCDYSVNTTNEQRSWDAKLGDLWQAVKSDTTSGKYPSPLQIITESVQTSFLNVADTMPFGRQKDIHAVGAVCKFNMKMASNSPFTGLFEAGSTAHGLLRMGSALAVTTSSGVVPGVGFKFLRSGVPSGNFVVLNRLTPLANNDYNFFAKPLSNHLPPPDTAATKVVAAKFQQASGCVTMVGLSDICSFKTDGTKINPINLRFPFKLVFDAGVTLPSTPVAQDKLQQMLVDVVKPNTVLYNVTAFTSATESVFLGSMVVDEACTNSAFGDASLFFRHQLIEEDWMHRPDFMAAVNPMADCGVSSISSTPPRQC